MRERRIKVDFHFDIKEAELPLLNQTSAKQFYLFCKEYNMKDAMNEIAGMVTLRSPIY